MQGFSNEDTISLHITDICNVRCPGCYLGTSRSTEVMSRSIIDAAIQAIKPRNIVFFGGEAILFPKLLLSVMRDYPDIHYVLHTNACIPIHDVLQRVDTIAATVDAISPTYFYLKYGKRPILYKNYADILIKYRDKIVITHNILPKNNDPNFFDWAKDYGRPVDCYVYVTACKEQEYLASFDAVFPIPSINVKPKIRVLRDGSVTRDMMARRENILGSIYEWNPYWIHSELSVCSKCEACPYMGRCHACNMFPHFCSSVLESIDYEPHFCKFTKTFWERKEEQICSNV